VADVGIGGEQGGHPEGQADGDDGEPDPSEQAQPEAAPADPVRPGGVADAEG
jgi:hypothetical protein